MYTYVTENGHFEADRQSGDRQLSRPAFAATGKRRPEIVWAAFGRAAKKGLPKKKITRKGKRPRQRRVGANALWDEWDEKKLVALQSHTVCCNPQLLLKIHSYMQ